MQTAEMDPELEVTGTALVRRAPMELSSPSEVAAAIAQRDDEQILAMMAGEVITEFFYEFRVGGKLVEGVSVTGANEFARIRADAGFPIRFPSGSIFAEEVSQNGHHGIRVIVTARDCRTGADGIGMCFQQWLVERKVRDEQGNVLRTEMVENNHADRKALSIAKRNAILSLLPEAQILVILRDRKKLIAANEREQRTLLADAQRQQQLPPAVATPASSRDPYAAPATTARETPAPAAPRPHEVMASDEQAAKLRFLIAKPTVPEDVRRKVQRRLHNGLPAKVADAWITTLEVAADPPAAAAGDDDSDDLGLGDARKTGHATVPEGQYEPVPRIADGH